MTGETEADLSGAEPPRKRRRAKPAIMEIGGRKLKPATLMMGHGYDPMLSEGSLKPPIFLTSTFAFESAAAIGIGTRQLRSTRSSTSSGLLGAAETATSTSRGTLMCQRGIIDRRAPALRVSALSRS